MKKTIMTSILIAAVAALMIPTIAMATIGDVLAGPTAPANTGNGRAIAYDGLTTLYYTNTNDPQIYRQTTAGADLGPIPLNNRGAFTCGALDFDGTNLICGTYIGSPAGFWEIDPTTGFATLLFTEAAFGNFQAGPCNGTGFVDGLAKDIDGTFWVSDDASSTLLKLNPDGSLNTAFTVPSRTGSALAGCNSGIDIAGDYLELVLVAFEADAIDANHEIVKVTKADPTTVIVRFFTNNPDCCEDISIDANTFAPLAALWAHGVSPGDITAYEVQITRTIGYWKNHSTDADPFLPIDLGDNSDTGTCRTVDDAAEVETVLKAHKGKQIIPKLQAQLLVAKLNVAIGDIPEPDLTDMQTAIDDADALLSDNTCNPNLSKFSSLLSVARTLHGILDDFNNKYSL